MGLTRLKLNQVEGASSSNSSSNSNATLTALASINSPGFLKKSGDSWITDNTPYLTSNQPIEFTGEVIGYGTTNIHLELAKSGVFPGTYHKVTVEDTGRVMAGGPLTGTDVISALGFTPYDSANPNAFISQSGALPEISSVVASKIGTTTIALNNNTPTSNQGAQIWADAIAPTSASNRINISGSFTFVSGTSSRTLAAVVFRGSTCIGVVLGFASSSNTPVSISINIDDYPSTTAETTYSVRVGTTSGATWYINQYATAYFNGKMATSVIALRELA